MTEELVLAPASFSDRIEALNHEGAKLFGEGHMEPARLHFLAALALDPRHASALQNLGAVLRNLGYYKASEIVAQRSVMITKRENPYCVSNLGVAQLGVRKFRDALETLKGVANKLPDSGPSWHNYGLALYMVGSYAEARAAFEKAIAIAPNAHLLSDRALTLLSEMKIQAGLEAYEVRWKTLHKNDIWKSDIPEWQGESLEGKRILIHHEQGFGDSLMLVRFVRQLAQRKCQITLAVPKELVRLFDQNFPSVQVLDLKDPRLIQQTVFDYHSPLLSVMRWINIRRPEDISPDPYLKSWGEFAMRLPLAKVKIGICWASGNHSPSLVDRRRLVPLYLFLPLLSNLDIALISLQKGEDVRDIVSNGLEGLIFDVSARVDDFADTANVISQLDLVISVDSAVAHLAGAMGKPCIMLSPYTRCWRWWSKVTGWPWYSRMKLYSQESNGAWQAPMKEAVERALWITKDMR